MAATVPLNVAAIILGIIAIASLLTLIMTIGERILGTPPPGHKLDKWARVAAASFVVFLAIGPLWVFTITMKGVCT